MTSLKVQESSNSIISTHTLTWSVTEEARELEAKCKISTHTLTWSVTKINALAGKQVIISTHTLTWSVTGKSFEFPAE